MLHGKCFQISATIMQTHQGNKGHTHIPALWFSCFTLHLLNSSAAVLASGQDAVLPPVTRRGQDSHESGLKAWAALTSQLFVLRSSTTLCKTEARAKKKKSQSLTSNYSVKTNNIPPFILSEPFSNAAAVYFSLSSLLCVRLSSFCCSVRDDISWSWRELVNNN